MSEKLKKERNRVAVSVAFFLLLILVEKVKLIPVLNEHPLLFLPLYLIPYFISGSNVVRECLLGIKNRRPFDEALLMTVATVGAFFAGEFAEAVAVMVFYQVGELFQSYAVGRSRASIKELMDIVPEYANVEREDGSIETVDPDEVKIGDILLIKAGEKVPVDGIVRSGESMVNTAALTGESVPRSVFPGDTIISGCINGEGLLRVEATKCFEDSTVSKILELVEEASEKKSKTENFITRFARIYTPIVVFAALALAIIPNLGLLFGVVIGVFPPVVWKMHPPITWLYRACTFLVVSCPCALVISVPLSFFGGIGAASREGILVKGSNYLELVSKLSILVTDKTGTLTKGNFVVKSLCPEEGISEDVLLNTAAIVENGSTHPIAQSILQAYKERWFGDQELLTPEEIVNRSGKGLIARVQSSRVLVGNEKLMEEFGIAYQTGEQNCATVCHVAVDSSYLGKIYIADEIKENSHEAIMKMKEEGVKEIVMLTGDSRPVAEEVGEILGVDRVYSELLPANKVEKVEELLRGLKKDGKQSSYLAFVGDGINDAPVLSRSDVGIAMGGMGSDAAIEAADIVIMDDDLLKIPRVISIGRRTVRIATQNIAFALGVKILVLLLSAFGFANMWAAVFADVGVTVICIVNAMRLLKRS
ncbi:MAG: heavy metal translocating P-type ATPase [Oribacterium parvum]|uniref:heavy metal translocating P-type ATPase n=1 Tax=Oribacterium parvum TaxID=1501329 RepID=UPI001CB1037D|nr:heavy metal translocating P-type ATPase [Oribacterium parvum]MBF1268988.1 heavy metal translocating P-type ATPase [Oribacterium parvum]